MPCRVFISHSSADKGQVSPLVRLLASHFSLSFDNKEIICTSSPEADLENNCLFNEALKDAIKEADLSIVVISPNYIKSEYCLCELGAIWAASKEKFIFNPQSIRRDYLPEIAADRKFSSFDEVGMDALVDKMKKIGFTPKDESHTAWNSLKKVALREIEENESSQKHIYLSAHMKRSEKIAAYFYEWLPQVIPDVSLFYSGKDIPKDCNDSTARVSAALKKSLFGIVFVTRENSRESQINVDRGGLLVAGCPCRSLLIDTDAKLPKDIIPIAEPVTTKKDSIRDLLLSIRSHAAEKYPIERIKEDFERLWPELEAKIREVQATKADPAEKRTGAPEWYEAVEEAEKVNPHLAEHLKNADTNDRQECRKLADELNKEINADISKRFVDVYNFYPPENVLAAIKAGQKFLPPETVKAIQNMQKIYNQIDLGAVSKEASAIQESAVFKNMDAIQKSFNRFKPLFPPDDDPPLIPVKKK